MKKKTITASRSAGGRIGTLTLNKQPISLSRVWDEKGFLHEITVSSLKDVISDTELITLFLSESEPPSANWFDRNSLTTGQQYYATVSNGFPQTTRMTYTVPIGKKAFVELLDCYIERYAVAAPAAEAWISFALNGNNTLFCRLNSNTVGASNQKTVGHSFLINAGDILEGVNYDNSTGGTIVFFMGWKITEFDAF